jgi:lactobin A/cerein 7B family class IIb bacteriocin
MKELTQKEIQQVNGGWIVPVARGLIFLGGMLYSAYAE